MWFYQVAPVYCYFYPILPTLSLFYLVLLSFTQFYQFLPVFKWFYLLVPAFSQFYLVLLSFTFFTGFSLIFPPLFPFFNLMGPNVTRFDPALGGWMPDVTFIHFCPILPSFT